MFLFAGCFLLMLCFLYEYGRCRKQAACRRVCRMTDEEKCRVLNEIIQPFGYCYEESQDIFSTVLHPWQRQYGYTKAYDRYAPHIGIVFDCAPVYFDYEGRTWLIELWKGQYGINTGGEVGIYRADRILSRQQRETAVFESVPDAEMMDLSIDLYRNQILLAQLKKRHWWLTIFDMGIYSEPEELSLKIRITFPCIRMLQAFMKGWEQRDGACGSFRINGLTVLLLFDESPADRHHGTAPALIRLIQWGNCRGCRLFRWVTRPFISTLDRMLCLYFYLPQVLRNVFWKMLLCERCGKRRWSF